MSVLLLAGHQGLRMGRLARPALPILYRSPSIRRFALRHIAANGASGSCDRALELTDDMLGCAIAEEMLSTEEWFVPMLDDPQLVASVIHESLDASANPR